MRTTIEPNDLALFALVATRGSFSRAAEQMGLPKSSVSRRISALEATLGERLLLRTTRKLTLTDFGHSVLEHARQVVAEVDAAAALAQSRQLEPSGRLRVSMPGEFATHVLGPLLAEFLARYPRITLELDLSPRRVDLIGENYDLAIRMGASSLPDDVHLAARPLAVFEGGLYAAPAYLRAHGEPAEPEALMEHTALRLPFVPGAAALWVLARGDARWEGEPPMRVVANSPELLLRLAREGAGIVAVGRQFADPYVQRGELARVLDGWAPAPVTAWAVFPGRRLMPTRTRVLLDALEARFAQCPAVQA